MPQIAPIFSNLFNGSLPNNYTQGTPLYMSNSPQAAASSPVYAPALHWLKDPTLSNAINELEQLEFDKNDIRYLNNMGLILPFLSGREAVEYIKNSNVRISFEKTTSKHIHAQYDYEKNLIMINDMYKGSQDFPVILAIGEAILHECGHAKDNDGDSSIQEELGNLGMNAIAHRAFVKKHGDIFKDSEALLVKDGVSVYSTLFFDPDPEKKELLKRIKTKYGYLPAGDILHPPSALAFKIKDKI